MWSLRLSPADADRDKFIAELWQRGTAGIIDELSFLIAFFESESSARQVTLDFPALASDLRAEPIQIPTIAAADDWEPIYAGTRFVIVPKGRIVLEVNAAMAFGSGRHETTQLCLEALESTIEGGETIIDIGCGSGILALAAYKLGAAHVIACDIQEDAIRTAHEHFHGPLFLGSADAIASESADLVIANISARIDDHIACDVHRILKPNGLLIVSGFIAEKTPRAFHPHRQLVRGEWLCWICTRTEIETGTSTEDPNIHPQNWF